MSTRVGLCTVSPDERLATYTLDVDQVPRKGESIVMGIRCYIINDVIWQNECRDVLLLLIGRHVDLGELKNEPLAEKLAALVKEHEEDTRGVDLTDRNRIAYWRGIQEYADGKLGRAVVELVRGVSDEH